MVSKSNPASATADGGHIQMPEGIRWSLLGATACGQQGYMRPCQRPGREPRPDAAYPLAKLCETSREAVFVVDDDEMFRTDLMELVESLGYKAIGCATADELQTLAPNYQSGCVLLDIRLPGQDGLAVQEWLNKMGIGLPVIFISGVQEVATVVHCMKAGAFEFLQKPIGEMALLRAINAAIGLSRKRHCQHASARMVKAMVDSLTPTETFVATMISRGYPTKLIAAEMDRSENTVKIHRHRIFNKLKVNSAASVANLIRHVRSEEHEAA